MKIKYFHLKFEENKSKENQNSQKNKMQNMFSNLLFERCGKKKYLETNEMSNRKFDSQHSFIIFVF